MQFLALWLVIHTVDPFALDILATPTSGQLNENKCHTY